MLGKQSNGQPLSHIPSSSYGFGLLNLASVMPLDVSSSSPQDGSDAGDVLQPGLKLMLYDGPGDNASGVVGSVFEKMVWA